MLYQVTVVGAERLRRADLFSKSDPYVIVYQKSRYGTIKGRTSEIDNTLDPTWNEQVGVLFSDDKPIKLKVYDSDLKDSPFAQAKLQHPPMVNGPIEADPRLGFRNFVKQVKGKAGGLAAKAIQSDDDSLGKTRLDLQNAPLGEVVTMKLSGETGTKKPVLKFRVDRVDPSTWPTPSHVATGGESLDMRTPWPFMARVSYRIAGAGALAQFGIPPVDLALVGFNEDGKVKLEAYLGDPVEKGVNINVEQRAEGNDLVGSIVMGISPADVFRKTTRATLLVTTTSERKINLGDLNLNLDLYYAQGTQPLLRVPLDAASGAMLVATIDHGIFRVNKRTLPTDATAYSEVLPELTQAVSLPPVNSRYTTVIPGRGTSLDRVAQLTRINNWHQLQLALRWKTEVPIDLDSNVAAFDAHGNPLYTVSYRALNSPDGAVRHGGDNRTGISDGDDEVIHLDLTRVQPNVKVLFLSVTSFSGQGFSQIKKVRTYLRVQGKQFGKVTLSEKSGLNAVVLAAIERTENGDWFLWPLLTYAHGKVSDDLRPIYKSSLQKLPTLRKVGHW